MSDEQTLVHAMGAFHLWREWKLEPMPEPGVGISQDQEIRDAWLEDPDPKVYLRSAMYGAEKTLWTDRVLEATCGIVPNEEGKGGHPEGQPIPTEGCTCGIYGYATLEDFIIPTFAGFVSGPVVGVMKVWGNFVLANFGARFQFARPVMLFVNQDYCAGDSEWYATQLRKMYECPTLVSRISDEWIEVKATGEQKFPNISPPLDLRPMLMQESEMKEHYTGETPDWGTINLVQGHRKLQTPAHTQKEVTNG